MEHPPHQVVADDVVIDGRQCAAGAQEALVGGTELTVWPRVAFMAANDIDEPVVQQREQRGELRHDGVIVIARIGDQRLGEGNADTCDAAVDPRHILGRVRAMSRNGHPVAGSFSFQRIRPSRSLVRRSSFGASSA